MATHYQLSRDQIPHVGRVEACRSSRSTQGGGPSVKRHRVPPLGLGKQSDWHPITDRPTWRCEPRLTDRACPLPRGPVLRDREAARVPTETSSRSPRRRPGSQIGALFGDDVRGTTRGIQRESGMPQASYCTRYLSSTPERGSASSLARHERGSAEGVPQDCLRPLRVRRRRWVRRPNASTLREAYLDS
jgi:hypothetical protein